MINNKKVFITIGSITHIFILSMFFLFFYTNLNITAYVLMNILIYIIFNFFIIGLSIIYNNIMLSISNYNLKGRGNFLIFYFFINSDEIKHIKYKNYYFYIDGEGVNIYSYKYFYIDEIDIVKISSNNIIKSSEKREIENVIIKYENYIMKKKKKMYKNKNIWDGYIDDSYKKVQERNNKIKQII